MARRLEARRLATARPPSPVALFVLPGVALATAVVLFAATR
jgi:hypothetical protein